MKTRMYMITIMAILASAMMNAQTFATLEESSFRSTSSMQMSGSALAVPNEDYAIETTMNGPRRVHSGEEQDAPESRKDPDMPIGGLPVAFMVLLAGGYAIWRRRATR